MWEDLDGYMSHALILTELKILVWVLANVLPMIVSDLIGSEKNYAVEARSIQNHLHLVHEIIEEIEAIETELIDSDLAKAFDRVDHLLLTVVLESSRF